MVEAIERTATSTHSGPRNAADVVVEALEAHGVDTVFGIPGVHTLALYDSLPGSSLRHILARHEQGAGFMADGYARASGRPGVAFIITGPGITNVATAIGEAYTDSSPVLVVSTNVEREYLDAMRGNLHDLKDQMGVMAAVTQWNTRVMSAADAPAAVTEAFRRLDNGRRRPVHIEFPLDVLDEAMPAGVSIDIAKREPVAPDPAAIADAVRRISAAGKVVVYLGGGAVDSAAPQAVIDIAERLGAPVLTSIMGKGGAPEDHPNVIGNLWDSGSDVDTLVGEADLMIVVGSKLGAQTTEMFSLKYPREMIRIDIDAEEMTRNATPTCPIVADAALAVTALRDALAAAGVSKSSFAADRIAAVKSVATTTGWGSDRLPYVKALRNAIPRDGIAVFDMTMMAYVSCRYYPVYEPRTFQFPSGYGTLGYSMPAALGAKAACPDKAVVAVIGDGGYQFTMQELATAIQFGLNVPIVIFNDSTYTAVKDAQRRERGSRFQAVDLINPDYVKLAEAYGVPPARPETPEALEAEIRAALKRDTPTIIDTPIPGWV
jgi:thiamine pyrophosphate-dependent acetolactate synthase large subunit-like protein